MGRQETVELQDSPEELADLGQRDPRDSVECLDLMEIKV